jgi:glycosyltransferase involved in cell wall biosynthesis
VTVRRAHVVLVLENNPYPMDIRVRPQVRALVEAGYAVTVVSPTGYGYDALEERDGPVRVLRFPGPPEGRGPLGYLIEYGLSMVRIVRLLRRVQRKSPIDLLFVYNPPDLLVVVKWLLRRPRPRLALDYREIVPELFEAKYGPPVGPLARLLRRALLWSERLAFKGADAVTSACQPFSDIAVRRGGIDPSRVFLVGNGPEEDRIFPVPPRAELRRGHERLVLWLGAMSRQEGLHRLIEAADELVNTRGRTDVGFAVVGPGDVHAELREEIRHRGLEHVVHVRNLVDDELVRAYISTADVCVGVDERNAMNDRAAMRKILEYMAAGRAVVQFPLGEMRRLCGDATAYAAEGDVRDLARVLDELLDDADARARLGDAARRRVQDAGLMWEHQVPSLLSAVETALAA